MTLFQFDYDLTFAVFFMNADKTIYGRYGTRSSVEEAAKDVSISGLAETMSAALEIHKKYPKNRSSLAGKQAIDKSYADFKTADDIPSLKGKYQSTLDYSGAAAKSCMHCHQVRDAARQVYRDAGKPIPDRLLFPNPLPDVVGLTMDPRRAATVGDVEPGSAADLAEFTKDDELLSLNGQPIISVADVQWVLHNSDATDELAATVRRAGRKVNLRLPLERDWRKYCDISWRVSSWPLRRMGTGGILFEAANDAQRRAAGVGPDEMALVVKHVGQYGPHGAAMRAGFKKSDVVVSFDGQTGNMTTSQLLAYAAQNTEPGQQVPVVIVRDGNRKTMSLPMQK
ncbi:MAG: PDZ domain-containing protein [Planctomycetales bacterium]|nr:PDZ domain-containing protein [Planctomycetales bacterium]